MKKILVSLIIGGALVSCSDKTQTMDYYVQHTSEMEQVLSKCRSENNASSNDCFNAMQAKARLEALQAATQTDIKAIKDSLRMYKLHNLNYPTQQQGLDALVHKPIIEPIPKNYITGGYLDKLPKDSWGNDYQYLNPGKHGVDVDVYSYGSDGNKSAGENGSTVIGSWQ